MINFLSFLDFQPEQINALAQRAFQLKTGSKHSKNLAGKTLGALFLNPSLRTRVSFEVAASKLGAQALQLAPNQNIWNLEFADGACMNSDKVEHVKDALRSLGGFIDALGIRSFAGLQDFEKDQSEPVLLAAKKYSRVPLINLESAFEHPCQALADMLTMREALGDLAGKNFVLSWVPHVKPLPLAVPHSALLAAAHSAMNVKLVCPPDYQPSKRYLRQTAALCEQTGRNFEICCERENSFTEADLVYAKSWGAPRHYQNPAQQQLDFERYAGWQLKKADLPEKAQFMHCLPVRRNLEVADDLLDAPQSLVERQAHNRLWSQMAVLEFIFDSKE